MRQDRRAGAEAVVAVPLGRVDRYAEHVRRHRGGGEPHPPAGRRAAVRHGEEVVGERQQAGRRVDRVAGPVRGRRGRRGRRRGVLEPSNTADTVTSADTARRSRVGVGTRVSLRKSASGTDGAAGCATNRSIPPVGERPRGPSVDAGRQSEGQGGRRLAHRGCNTRKGAIPVVTSGRKSVRGRTGTVGAVAERLGRKGGREVVARCPTRQEAQQAAVGWSTGSPGWYRGCR